MSNTKEITSSIINLLNKSAQVDHPELSNAVVSAVLTYLGDKFDLDPEMVEQFKNDLTRIMEGILPIKGSFKFDKFEGELGTIITPFLPQKGGASAPKAKKKISGRGLYMQIELKGKHIPLTECSKMWSTLSKDEQNSWNTRALTFVPPPKEEKKKRAVTSYNVYFGEQTKKTSLAWKGLSDIEKKKYNDTAKELELPAGKKRSITGYNLYCKEHAPSKDVWVTMSESARKPYDDIAVERTQASLLLPVVAVSSEKKKRGVTGYQLYIADWKLTHTVEGKKPVEIGALARSAWATETEAVKSVWAEKAKAVVKV